MPTRIKIYSENETQAIFTTDFGHSYLINSLTDDLLIGFSDRTFPFKKIIVCKFIEFNDQRQPAFDVEIKVKNIEIIDFPIDQKIKSGFKEIDGKRILLLLNTFR